jgi:tetratricopeptide (TPR) repeat protein
VDLRADLHALGLMLYELASGVNPYVADDVPKILRKVLDEEPRRLGDLNPQLSPFFEEVVHCLLAKSPDARFASAAELVAVLEQGEDSEWWHTHARALQAKTQRPLRRIRIPRETAVYGRDAEIATMEGLFERAESGDGQVVLIEGEAGIGKSRLVDELISRLQARGADLNFLFGSYPPNGAATAAGAFSAAYREHFGDAGSAAHLAQTPALVPAFDALLSGSAAPGGVAPLTKDSLQTCFVNATRSLAAERVTVVLIDDLHFAPEGGRALFTSLAMAVPGHRVLLIGTTRPSPTSNWQGGLDRFGHTTRLMPQRLAAKDLVRLLEEAFQSQALAESLGLQIIVKSDGNPFFAFEIIRGLREGQFITQSDDGTWVTTRVIDEIQIPSSVLDLVNARVADLSEAERDVLDVACCWGFEFDPLTVGEVLGLGRIPLLKCLSHIERQHRLVRASGRRYVFDHHQVQEALYGSLSELLREEYHAALAEALETRTRAVDQDPEKLDGALCLDLCEHFLNGGRAESAARYADRALTHLEDGFLNPEAVALAERILDVDGLLTPERRAAMLLRLAKLLVFVGRREPGRTAAKEAEALAQSVGDTALAAEAALALGRNLLITTAHADAGVALHRALGLARASGNRATEADALRSLGLLQFFRDRFDEAARHVEQAGKIRQELGDRHGECDQAGSMAEIYYATGRLDEACAEFERAIALARDAGHPRAASRCTGNLGLVVREQGRLDEALRLSRHHWESARETGNRGGEAIALGSQGVITRDLGRLDESRELLERYITLSREIGNRRGEVIGLLNLGITLADLGEPRGVERLSESRALATDLGVRQAAAAAGVAMGEWFVRVGDHEAARDALTDAAALIEDGTFPDLRIVALATLALLPGGDPAPAVAEFTEHRARVVGRGALDVRFALFRATGDDEHLVEAKRLLDETLAVVAEEHHEAMRTGVRINSEILAAWGERSR